MFAIIKTGGKQYRVQSGDLLNVEKLGLEKGQKVNFEQVLLVEDGEKTLIGTPLVENAIVSAEVIENIRDKKVIVFKKKRRKQYKRKRGHRQELTQVRIEGIFPDRRLVVEAGPAISKEVPPAPEKPKEAQEEKPKVKREEKKVLSRELKTKAKRKAVESRETKKEVSPKKKAVARPVTKEKAKPKTKE